jgi:hypothetical protein
MRVTVAGTVAGRERPEWETGIVGATASMCSAIDVGESTEIETQTEMAFCATGATTDGTAQSDVRNDDSGDAITIVSK